MQGIGWRLAVALLRALLVFPLSGLALTLFALWPWSVGPPFFLVRPLGFLSQAPRSSALRLILLRLALRTDWSCRGPGRIRVNEMLDWLLRPFRVTIPQSASLARREREWCGKSHLEGLILFLNALPDSYRYANGLVSRFWFDSDRRDAAGYHIPSLPYHVRVSCYALNHALNPAMPLAQRHHDKGELYRTCRRHGWPTVPLIASFKAGDVTEHDPIPAGPLISKPAGLAEGRGHFERWWPAPTGASTSLRYRTERREEIVPLDEVFDRVAGRSLLEPYVLQPLLTSHAAIRELSGVKTLCTLRLPTCCHVDGSVELLPLALFRMPTSPDAACDNMAQGGVAYRVDTETGRLERGAVYGSREPYVLHPGTSRRAVGFELPFFDEAVRLVTEAHGMAYSTFPTVGWDIALTDQGPLILEMNVQWATQHDIPGEGFLGRTAYTECILGHIRRLWPEAFPHA